MSEIVLMVWAEIVDDALVSAWLLMSLSDVNKIYFSDMIILPREKHFRTAVVRVNASINIACTSILAFHLVMWVSVNHHPLHKKTHCLWNIDANFTAFHAIYCLFLPFLFSFLSAGFQKFPAICIFYAVYSFQSLPCRPWPCLFCWKALLSSLTQVHTHSKQC